MKRRATKRRGISLLEVVTVVSMISLVLGMAATLLAAAMRLDRGVQQHREQQTALARLGSQLRTDAHAALEAAAVADQRGVLLEQSGERQVRYTPQPDGVLREVLDGEKTVHRDTFRLPRGLAAGLEIRETGARQRIVATIETTGDFTSSAVSRQPRRIEALVRLHSASIEAEDSP